MQKGLKAAHIVSNHKEDGCDRRHGNQCRIRHQNHEYQYQCDGMYHSGDRSPAAVFNIGSGSCDGTRSRNSSKQRRSDITNSLCNQLHIGTVSGIDHTVCHHTGKQ